MSNTSAKKWYKSRTIIVMAIFALLPVIYMYLIKEPIPLESVLYASGQALVGILLRFVTKQPITAEFLDDTVSDAVEDLMDKSRETQDE